MPENRILDCTTSRDEDAVARFTLPDSIRCPTVKTASQCNDVLADLAYSVFIG